MSDGGPAFPRPMSDVIGDALFTRIRDKGADGMSLRDYLAAAAMTGHLSNPSMIGVVTEKWLAAASYEVADAMLRAREGGQDD